MPKPTFAVRAGLGVLVIILVALPFLTIASQRAVSTMLNTPPLWAPATLAYRQDYDWFRAHFHCDDLFLLSYEGCTLDDPRADQLADALASPAGSNPDAELLRQSIQSVTAGPRLLRELLASGRYFGGERWLWRPEAIERLEGSFVGPDGQTTCLVVTLTFDGALRRGEVIDAVRRATQQVVGVTASEVHMAGAPVDGATIDQASVRAIDRLTLPATLLAAAICLAVLRSPLLTGGIVLVALTGQALVLATVDAIGSEMNAVLIVLPALVFVLTVSAGVHLANYFFDGVAEVGPAQAPAFALRAGRWPCFLASLTTIVGLLSLLANEMSPVRLFGVVASFGVAVCLALLFGLLPGAMHAIAARASLAAGQPRSGRLLTAVADRVVAAPRKIALGFLLVMAVLTWGVTQLKTSVSVSSLFAPGSLILADYDWLSEKIGPLVSLEVVLKFPEEGPLSPLEQLHVVQDAGRAVEGIEGLGGVLSAATFFPEVTNQRGASATYQRSQIRLLLEREMTTLEEAGHTVRADGVRAWRVSARALASYDNRYDELLAEVRGAVQPVLDKRPEGSVSMLLTGSLPVAFEAQRALLRGLFRSFLAAFVLVAIVMVVVMRGVVAGLVAMLPNLFPTVVLFGAMGWLGTPVDIGAVMTASVALGIAVDDTLHFVLWWRRERRQGATPEAATRSALGACGRAMTHTTLICGLGLLVYGLSDFVPTARFAWFMLGLLMAALVGDLVFLPALLVGPAGRWMNGHPPMAPDNGEASR